MWHHHPCERQLAHKTYLCSFKAITAGNQIGHDHFHQAIPDQSISDINTNEKGSHVKKGGDALKYRYVCGNLGSKQSNKQTYFTRTVFKASENTLFALKVNLVLTHAYLQSKVHEAHEAFLNSGSQSLGTPHLGPCLQPF